MSNPRQKTEVRPGSGSGSRAGGRSDSVELYTLGGVRLLRQEADETSKLGTKHLALLIYLFHERRPMHPSEVYEMLGRGQDDEKELDGLRRAVAWLKEHVPGLYIKMSPDTIEGMGGLWLDTKEVDSAIDGGDPGRVAELYRGEFLADFESGSQEFDAWADKERNRLRRAWTNAMLSAAHAAEETGSWRTAAAWWEVLVERAPLRAEAVASLLRCHSRAKNPDAATRAYGEYLKRLRQNGGAEPADAVQEAVTRFSIRAPAAPDRDVSTGSESGPEAGADSTTVPETEEPDRDAEVSIDPVPGLQGSEPAIDRVEGLVGSEPSGERVDHSPEPAAPDETAPADDEWEELVGFTATEEPELSFDDVDTEAPSDPGKTGQEPPAAAGQDLEPDPEFRDLQDVPDEFAADEGEDWDGSVEVISGSSLSGMGYVPPSASADAGASGLSGLVDRITDVGEKFLLGLAKAAIVVVHGIKAATPWVWAALQRLAALGQSAVQAASELKPRRKPRSRPDTRPAGGPTREPSSPDPSLDAFAAAQETLAEEAPPEPETRESAPSIEVEDEARPRPEPEDFSAPGDLSAPGGLADLPGEAEGAGLEAPARPARRRLPSLDIGQRLAGLGARLRQHWYVPVSVLVLGVAVVLWPRVSGWLGGMRDGLSDRVAKPSLPKPSLPDVSLPKVSLPKVTVKTPGFVETSVSRIGEMFASPLLEESGAWIVVGDVVVDGTPHPGLTQALSSYLSQASFFYVVPRERAALALGRRAEPLRLPLEVALQLADSGGHAFVVTAALVRSEAGDSIKARVQAPDGEERYVAAAAVPGEGDVLTALEAVAAAVRQRLGEPEEEIKADAGLARTFPSAPAAQTAYSRARAQLFAGRYAGAEAAARRAIAVDSTFALAYQVLAEALALQGQRAAARAALEDAWELRSRLPEREQLRVRADRLAFDGRHSDAVLAYDALFNEYRDDVRALKSQALLQRMIGVRGGGEGNLRVAYTISPLDWPPLERIARYLNYRGALPDVDAWIESP